MDDERLVSDLTKCNGRVGYFNHCEIYFEGWDCPLCMAEEKLRANRDEKVGLADAS